MIENLESMGLTELPDESDADADALDYAGLCNLAQDRQELMSGRCIAAMRLLAAPEWADEHPLVREAVMGSFPRNIRAMLEAEGAAASRPPLRRLDDMDDDGDGGWPAVASLLAFQGQSTIISGAGKSGKTTMAAALAVGVAEGKDWLSGEARPPAEVLWLAAPGESNRADVRVSVLATGCGKAILNRIVCHYGGLAGVLESVRDNPLPDVRLVVADSMRGFMPDSEDNLENDSGAVRRIWKQVEAIREACHPDAAMLAIHHARRKPGDDGKWTRGSGDWLATFGNIVELIPDTGGRKLSFQSRAGGPSGSRLVSRYGPPTKKRFRLDNQKRAKKSEPAAGKYDEAAIDAAAAAGPDGIGLSALKKSMADAMGTKLTGGPLERIKESIARLVEAGRLLASGTLYDYESKNTIIRIGSKKDAGGAAE